MKPYQTFTCKNFPLSILKEKGELKKEIQRSLYGEEEEGEIETSIRLINENYEHGLSLFKIKSSVYVSALGYITRKPDRKSKVQKFDFARYLHPVDFYGYYHKESNIVLLQAKKLVCREVLKQLKNYFPNAIELIPRRVDFGGISKLVDDFSSTWFRGISAEVSSANLTGKNIQEDHYFKEFFKRASISNVTFPYEYQGDEHRVMVTENSAVVLVQDYDDNIEFELGLVLYVNENIVKRLWVPIEPNK